MEMSGPSRSRALGRWRLPSVFAAVCVAGIAASALVVGWAQWEVVPRLAPPPPDLACPTFFQATGVLRFDSLELGGVYFSTEAGESVHVTNIDDFYEGMLSDFLFLRQGESYPARVAGYKSDCEAMFPFGTPFHATSLTCDARDMRVPYIEVAPARDSYNATDTIEVFGWMRNPSSMTFTFFGSMFDSGWLAADDELGHYIGAGYSNTAFASTVEIPPGGAVPLGGAAWNQLDESGHLACRENLVMRFSPALYPQLIVPLHVHVTADSHSLEVCGGPLA